MVLGEYFFQTAAAATDEKNELKLMMKNQNGDDDDDSDDDWEEQPSLSFEAFLTNVLQFSASPLGCGISQNNVNHVYCILYLSICINVLHIMLLYDVYV